ncbi:uncharacterized protein LOC100214787 isoform X5 [Hydra vulgaris]|uniref:Uncharacterized protein LOC100214787 isoform X5 n=1 Tax=Hydra vulgaris TaxID=6087 RepID=A0ABM4C253_HYDVU
MTKILLDVLGYYFFLSAVFASPILTLTDHIEQCQVIGNFSEESNIKRIADTSWLNGCTGNKFITGVWSEDVTGRFVKAKCCGNLTDNHFTWEIRDLSFFHKGSSEVNEKWNIECDKHAIITGFRFAADKKFIFLSSVRCSLLIDKVVDKNDCQLLEFNQKPDLRTGYKDKWQYECPAGFGLVGLYDDQSFMSIKKAKCCNITDQEIKPGWKSNFFDNLAGYIQDNNNYDFELEPEGYLITNKGRPFSPKGDSTLTTRIISSGFSSTPFCFLITQVVVGNGVTNIYLRNNSTDLLIKVIKPILKAQSETFHIMIKPSSRSQLVIESILTKGIYTIEELSIKEEGFCKLNCLNCTINEECLQQVDKPKCVCKTNFVRDDNGTCVFAPHSTKNPISGISKGPGVDDFSHTKSTVTKNNILTTFSDKSTLLFKSVEKNNNLTLVVIAAVFGAVALLVIILAVYLCFRNNIPIKLKRMSSFELQLHEIEKIEGIGYANARFSSHQVSMDSITSVSNSFYRSYMNNIGAVEEISAPTVEIVNRSSLVSVKVDRTGEEPIYTRIKQSHNQNEASFLNQSFIMNDTEDEGKQSNHLVNFSGPEYGDSVYDEDLSSAEFCTPGSDEEELLTGLHEIDKESIDITAKVLGQGAFGLVKLAILLSVKGKSQVAVKILKKGYGSSISYEDRVSFWQEAAIMSQFDHPNVISFYGVLVGKIPSMVVEYLPRGNLWKYLKTAQRLRKAKGVHTINQDLHKLFLRMARNINAGITYLASLKFVHRDLAARNILLDSDLTCKIADFGLSRHFLSEEQYYLSNGGRIPVKWTAPEALQFNKYSSKSDVWSYGIVLWEIWSIGIPPYGNWCNDKVIKEVCENNYRLPAPSGVPNYIYKLMLDCWNFDKNKRPSFSQIKFSLRKDDDQILGKNHSAIVERVRSLTFPSNKQEVDSFENNISF